MASKKVVFENGVSVPKIAPVGFSWTTLVFCFWPAVLRKDWKNAAIQAGCACVTVGVSYLVFPFLYNKIYIKSLLAEGYKAVSVDKGSLREVEAELELKLR